MEAYRLDAKACTEVSGGKKDYSRETPHCMISTITVNYKTADYLETLLDSLFAFHPVGSVEVIVVENGSGDDLSRLQAKFPQVKFIYSEKNRICGWLQPRCTDGNRGF